MTINLPLIAFTGGPVPPSFVIPSQDGTPQGTRGCSHLRASEPPEQFLLVLKRPIETAAVGNQICRETCVHNNPSQLWCWGRGQQHHKELKARLAAVRSVRRIFSFVDIRPERSPSVLVRLWPKAASFDRMQLPSSPTYVRAKLKKAIWPEYQMVRKTARITYRV